MRRWVAVAAAAGVAVTSACALRLGGPSPVDYTLVALDARGSTAQEAGAQITGAGADFAIVVGERESTWFSDLAAASALQLSGPAYAPDAGLAFVSRLPLLGDTALVLAVGTDSIYVQDALYTVEDERFLDLMLVRIGAGVNLQDATRILLEYMATDVMANAALVLGVVTPSPNAAQQVEEMLRAAFTTAAECAGMQDEPDRAYRIFLGPAARVRCEDASPIPGGIRADISVGLR